jgi:hypothetical protein
VPSGFCNAPLDNWNCGCRFGTVIQGMSPISHSVQRSEFKSHCRFTEMAPEPCQHLKRVRGVVELDFARQDDPGDPIYTAPVSVGMCEDSGHIELHAMFHQLLGDWLKKS